MKKIILAMLLSLLMITSVFAVDYTIELVDSYGDSWNGGMVTVSVNGTAVLTDITLTEDGPTFGAGPEAHVFSVEPGDVIFVDYTAGQYGSENEYRVKDENGIVVAESGTGYSETPGDVTYTLPAADALGMALLISPANMAGNVALDATLQWTAGANSVSSVLYFAENAELTDATVVNPATSPYSPTLVGETTYYWKVVAVNAALEEVESEVRSFTTLFPVVTDFPWTEGFEDWTTTSAPASWSQISVSGLNPWVSTTGTPHSGLKCAKAPYASAGNEHLLITPTFDLDAGTDYRLKFWLKGSDYWDVTSLTVQIAGDYVDATSFTEELAYFVGGTNMPATWTEQTISLAGYSGNQAIAFRLIDDDGMHFYIDDVTIEETPQGTLIQITPDVKDFGDVNIGYEATQTFTISNNGVIDASITEFSVPNGFSLESEESWPLTLAVGESFTIDVTFAPIAVLPYSGNLRVKEADTPFSFVNHDVALTGAGIPVPQGATCADPIALTFPTGTITNDTESFIDNYSSTWITPNSTYLNGNDVVYQFTLANSRLLNGTISSNGYYLGAFILQAEPVDPLVGTPANVILAKTSYSDDLAYTNYMLSAGTYYLIISSSTSTQSLDYTINLTADALPIPGAATSPSPATAAIDQPTVLSLGWTNAANTETIDLYLGVAGAREMTLVLDDVAKVNTYNAIDLLPNATYNWMVVNRNYTGETATPVTWSFTTIGVAPGLATYTAPANAATAIAPSGNLTWQATTGAQGYRVYLGTDDQFTGVTPVEQTTTSYAFSGLDFETTYYWKVVPYNVVGFPTEGVLVWSFTTIPSPFPEADLVFDGARAVNQGMPMEPYYGYTITQNIYNQEELNIEDSAINSISYLYNNTSAWSETIEIYMGHTTKDVFDTTTDWITSGLTHVYSGTMAVTTTESVVNLALSTPFVYNNIDNLVVVFFATETGYHGMSDEFYNYPVVGNKSLQYQSDGTNPYATWPTPPASGNLKAYRPVTGFNYQTLSQEATFTVSADTLAYPETEMGLTSLAQNLSVSNLGLAELGITGITVAGTNADQFVLTDTNVYPVALGAGESMSVSVVYTPTTEGEHTAELQITDNQNRVVNTVQLVASSVDNNVYAADLPWNASFEGDLAGWRYMAQSTSADAGVFISEADDAQDGDVAIQLYAGYDASTVLSFISPTFIDGLTNTRLTYWVKGSSGSTLTVGTYNQAIDTFTSIETITVPTTYTEFDLSFLPVRTGERIAFVTDFSSTYQNIYLDNLQVEVISQNSVAELSVEALDFVDTIVNEESDSLTVTVKNLGMAPLTITDVVLAGVNPNDFSFTYDTEAMTLAYDETFDIYVEFNPLMEGERAATLEISNNISRAVDNVALTGTAVDPAIYEIEIPYTLDFETEAQLLGWSADITSTGAATATRYSSSFSAHAGTYSYRLYHPTTDSTNVKLISPLVVPDMNLYRIRFWAKKSNTSNTDPIVIGKYNADMTTFTAIQSLDLTSTYAEYTVEMIEPERANERIVFNFASNQAYQNIYIDDVRFEAIPLVPLAELNVTEIDFGDVDVEQAESATETVTITNVGPSILTITDVAITGTDAGLFTWEYDAETPDMDLANGETLEINVTFAPTTEGDKVATLVITDNLGRTIRMNSATKATNNSRNANEVALTGFGWVPPQGSTCADPLPLAFPVVGVTGTTEGFIDDYSSSWVAPSSNYLGGDDVVYQFTLVNAMMLNGSITPAIIGDDIGALILQDEPVDPTLGTPAPIILSKTSMSTALTYTNNFLPAGTYYLIISSWPSPQSFDFTINLTADPLPIPGAATTPTPEIDAADQPTALTLEWTNADYTETIDLWFGVAGARDMALVLDDVAAVDEYEVTGLLTNTVYNWKVVNRNYTGETATPVTWSFTTVAGAPAAVTYTAPADASIDRPLAGNLSWATATGAEGYRVYLGTDNQFTGVTPVEQPGTSYAYSGLDYSTTYYWKVLPYNVVGVPTEDVLVWSFTTIADPTIPIPVTIDFEGSTTVPAAYITSTNMSVGASIHANTSNILYKNVYSTSSNAYVQFQAMNGITATSVIEFDYRVTAWSAGTTAVAFEDGHDYLIAKVSVDNGATFTAIDQINSTNHVDTADMTNYSVDISAYAGQSVTFRFEMNDDTVNDYWFDIDNIHFGEPIPEDPDMPINVVMDMDSASMTITWDAAANANSYMVYSCDTPDGPEGEWFMVQQVAGTTYTATADATMKFYKVKASSETVTPAKGFNRRGRN